MTLADLAASEADFLSVEDVAAVIHRKAQQIRTQARADPAMLGFPVIVTENQITIPREGFLHFCRFGNSRIIYTKED